MSHHVRCLAFYLAAALALPVAAHADPTTTRNYNGPDFDLTAASVTYVRDLDLLVFEQQVAGTAGGTTPVPRGALHGAPVLAYVFPTTLEAAAIGFGPTEGIVALAVTSHPDMDDTPLWDENGDGNYGNDGLVWHTHWVVLVKDARVPGGLSVKAYRKADAVVVPPTHPGMPMYLDSPGFAVARAGRTLKVLVPAARVRGTTTFSYDAVTAYLEVYAPDQTHADAAGAEKPMLGVYAVYEVLSGALTLPYRVAER